MKILKFLQFSKKIDESAMVSASPSPVKTPTPTKTPTKTPRKAPGRPDPIRRDKPGVEPNPKALKKASEKDVSSKFVDMMKNKGNLSFLINYKASK